MTETQVRSYRWLAVLAALLVLAWWFPAERENRAPTRAEAPASEARAKDARRANTPLPEARSTQPKPSQPAQSHYPDFLPPEAHRTLDLIARGGPYPHRQDGMPFQNREARLPRQPKGYYREFTVRTPGEHDRGARRIITGGRPPIEYYYTDDHYRSFRPFAVTRE